MATTYNINGKTYMPEELPNLKVGGKNISYIGGGSNPYIGTDLEEIAANRAVIEAQLGLIPGLLSEVELQQAYAQAQFEAGALELPVLQDQRDIALLGSAQAVERAGTQRDLTRSSNQGERLGIQDQSRQTNRDLSLLPPDVARTYSGSNFIDPRAGYARDDAKAKLGILAQRGSTVDLSDASADQNLSHTTASSALATRAANNQFAAREAMFNTRDEQLAAQMQGFENSKARINMGNVQGAASTAALNSRMQRVTNPNNNSIPQSGQQPGPQYPTLVGQPGNFNGLNSQGQTFGNGLPNNGYGTMFGGGSMFSNNGYSGMTSNPLIMADYLNATGSAFGDNGYFGRTGNGYTDGYFPQNNFVGGYRPAWFG